MLGPNPITRHLDAQQYNERLDHAARLHLISRDRKEAQPVNREAHRRMTVARLAASATAVALTLASAANVAASHPAGGGAFTLIR